MYRLWIENWLVTSRLVGFLPKGRKCRFMYFRVAMYEKSFSVLFILQNTKIYFYAHSPGTLHSDYADSKKYNRPSVAKSTLNYRIKHFHNSSSSSDLWHIFISEVQFYYYHEQTLKMLTKSVLTLELLLYYLSKEKREGNFSIPWIVAPPDI